MKKRRLLLCCIFLLLGCVVQTFAQAPQQFNYQGAARQANGMPLANKNISLRLSILDGSASGASQYSETRSVMTNALGLYHVIVGSTGANAVTGSIANVTWATGSKFIKVEVDPNNGSNFSEAGTAQLLSVPYALYSANGGGATEKITTLIDNNDGTYTYTSENATVTIINVPASVKKTIQEILNDNTVQNAITQLINKNAGNVSYNAGTKKFSYRDSNGQWVEIDLSEFFKANETETTLIKNIATSVYTYKNERGVSVDIDVINDVKNNFSTIVNDNSVRKIIEEIAGNSKGIIKYDSTTQQITYVDNSGNSKTLIIPAENIAGANVSTDASGKVVLTNNTGAALKPMTINIDESKLVIPTTAITGKDVTTDASGKLVLTDNTGAALKPMTINIDESKLVIPTTAITGKDVTTDASGKLVLTDNTGAALKAMTINIDESKLVIPTTAITGKDVTATNKLTLTNNTGAALTAMTLDVNEANLTLSNMGGKVNTTQINGSGTAGQVLTTDGAGNTNFSNVSTAAIAGENVSTDASGKLVLTNNTGAALKPMTINIDESKLVIPTTAITGKDVTATNKLTLTNNTGAALTAMTLDVNEANLTLSNMGGKVNTTQINGTGTAGQVLTTDGAGVATFSNLPPETITSLTDVVKQDSVNGEIKDIHTLTYKNEAGVENAINIATLIKGSETLTSLVYDGLAHKLIYQDENGNKSEFNMGDLVLDGQTLTTLKINTADRTLDYLDEKSQLNKLSLAPLVQEPWFSSSTNIGAVSNTEDIYTQGWVGIGYTTPSTAPDEKLRVNGTISTVNSYYADYVFEDYFKGNSAIKSSYKFKSLPEVDAFIKANNHLPGITPIHQLAKTSKGYSFNLSELAIQLLEKTEELYLHVIEQGKQLTEKERALKSLEQRVAQLEDLLLKTHK